MVNKWAVGTKGTLNIFVEPTLCGLIEHIQGLAPYVKLESGDKLWKHQLSFHFSKKECIECELHRRCIILVYKWLYTLNQFCFLLNSGIRIA
jgi:hypothetical protein